MCFTIIISSYHKPRLDLLKRGAVARVVRRLSITKSSESSNHHCTRRSWQKADSVGPFLVEHEEVGDRYLYHDGARKEGTSVREAEVRGSIT
ncbi:MAG: hypothetical protein ACFFER_14715 [Candidatus Thorarchaeota archaeon]